MILDKSLQGEHFEDRAIDGGISMRFSILSAVAACLIAAPASAATKIELQATTASINFLFDKPVTGIISLYIEIGFVYPNGGDIIDYSDALYFNDQRRGNFQFSAWPYNETTTYRFLKAITYSVQVEPSIDPIVNIRSAFGVPEPATWALMILGFGAVGGALRRRSRVAALA